MEVQSILVDHLRDERETWREELWSAASEVQEKFEHLLRSVEGGRAATEACMEQLDANSFKHAEHMVALDEIDYLRAQLLVVRSVMQLVLYAAGSLDDEALAQQQAPALRVGEQQ